MFVNRFIKFGTRTPSTGFILILSKSGSFYSHPRENNNYGKQEKREGRANDISFRCYETTVHVIELRLFEQECFSFNVKK